jgi:hypothetical protein
MRIIPNRFSFPERPVIVKKQRALLVHLSPPVKGLMDDAKSGVVDAQFAAILTNMYVQDDRLTCRAGYEKVTTVAGGNPIEHLIPYYGSPELLLAATNGELHDAQTGALLKGGFTSNDWHWTMHSDLGDTDYVVMVNGNDGVWSWDGLAAADIAPVTITKIGMPTAPDTDAVITVAAGDIAKFHNNDAVVISGADPAHSIANGPQRIGSVDSTANTFVLLGTNASAWLSDQTTGTMLATVQGSFTVEAVKPPVGNTWLKVNEFAIVTSHMNRLFFAGKDELAIYYLPLQQRYGEISVLPLNSIFRRGGTIKAMGTWTVDGGRGMDDQLVIFTSNGEVAIYSGVDPDNDFTLVGVFRMEAPMSKWSVMNYGGELYLLNPVGLVPMSTVLKSGREGLEASDKTVVTRFQTYTSTYRDNPGWELQFNPNTGRAMCNIPQGGGVYKQMMRNMAKPSWAEWKGVPARCWGWINPYLYFGDDVGNIYRMHSSIQSDNGKPIYIDVQTAWSQFKTPAIKHFKMILPYVLTDGAPKPSVDVKVDFDNSIPINTPSITELGANNATWDLADWDTSDWVWSSKNWSNWTGVGSIGRVGAIRMTAAVYNCSFSILGWDVLYDRGSVFG